MKTRVRFRHEHERDPARVEEIVAWVVAQATEIPAGLAVRVRAPAEHGYPNGSASYAERDWARSLRCRWAIFLRLAAPPYEFGIPRVCWHSSVTRQRHWQEPRPPDGMQVTVADALAEGKTRVGRWPIYRIDDWEEALVHLAAHEVSHIVQEQRGRGQSEIICEEFAAATLTAWRER